MMSVSFVMSKSLLPSSITPTILLKPCLITHGLDDVVLVAEEVVAAVNNMNWRIR